jgi:hypothetical protein
MELYYLLLIQQYHPFAIHNTGLGSIACTRLGHAGRGEDLASPGQMRKTSPRGIIPGMFPCLLLGTARQMVGIGFDFVYHCGTGFTTHVALAVFV